MNKFGPCNASNGYGFNASEPCIFLKLNRVSWQKSHNNYQNHLIDFNFLVFFMKIFNWIPQPYKNASDFPPTMPNELKSYIESLPEQQVICNDN